jgi:hypothetical protein
MVERAEVRSLGARGLGLPLLRMAALFKPENSVRMFVRRSRDKTLRNSFAFETSVISPCPIAYSCVPARDVPFFAHLVTSALGAFSVCLLVRLRTIGNATRINRHADCFKDFCVCKAGLSSGVEGETYNFQCLSLFSRHPYLQGLGNTSIGRPRTRIKRFHLRNANRCRLLSKDAASSLMGLIGYIIRLMSDVIHIYGGSYETCPVCGHKCPYDGGIKDFVSEPVIRPADWEIELNCLEHGQFSVLAGDSIACCPETRTAH